MISRIIYAIGGKFYEWRIRRYLKKIDLPSAALAITEGARGKVLPGELAELLTEFRAHPNEANALKLIAYDPKIAEMIGAFSKYPGRE